MNAEDENRPGKRAGKQRPEHWERQLYLEKKVTGYKAYVKQHRERLRRLHREANGDFDCPPESEEDFDNESSHPESTS
jgi:hypothetical protein